MFLVPSLICHIYWSEMDDCLYLSICLWLYHIIRAEGRRSCSSIIRDWSCSDSSRGRRCTDSSQNQNLWPNQRKNQNLRPNQRKKQNLSPNQRKNQRPNQNQRTKTEPETKPEDKPEPEPKPEEKKPEPEPKPEDKPDQNLRSKPEDKPEPDLRSKPEEKTEPDPESKSEENPAAAADAVVVTETNESSEETPSDLSGESHDTLGVFDFKRCCIEWSVYGKCSCGSVVEHCVSSSKRWWVQFPGNTHTDNKCISWMHCKSLWIKAFC